MKTNYKRKTLYIIVFMTLLNCNCKNENFIDKYDINVDSLKTFSNSFYAYRRGRIYLEDVKVENYRIWFNIDNLGNVENIFKIDDFRNENSSTEIIIKTYKIDTVMSKVYAQKFIDLSRKYKFGHVNIDKPNKISFSYKEELVEQYVKTLMTVQKLCI